MAVLFIEFVKMIPVSLVSCSLWHHWLQSVAFPPLFLSFIDSSSSFPPWTPPNQYQTVLMSAHFSPWTTFICQWMLIRDMFSAVRNSYHCTLIYTDTHIALGCVYEHSSDLCIKISLKFCLTVQESLRNWAQFILYSICVSLIWSN